MIGSQWYGLRRTWTHIQDTIKVKRFHKKKVEQSGWKRRKNFEIINKKCHRAKRRQQQLDSSKSAYEDDFFPFIFNVLFHYLWYEYGFCSGVTGRFCFASFVFSMRSSCWLDDNEWKSNEHRWRRPQNESIDKNQWTANKREKTKKMSKQSEVKLNASTHSKMALVLR